MERLIVVRHGFPDHMVTGRTGGWTDSHLTDLGHRQAKATGPAVARMLRGHEYVFYTSDLARTRETADGLSEALDRSAQPTDALREQSLGQANNLSTADADRIALPPSEGPLLDRVFYPGAETWREMMHRVFAFLDRLHTEAPDTALLVSHAGASICIVFWWLHLAPQQWPDVQFEFDLCSITEGIHGDFGGRRIRRLNDVRHLGELHA